jgi:hypothetical protein
LNFDIYDLLTCKICTFSNKGQSEIIQKNIFLTFQWSCLILYLYKQFLRLGQNIPLSSNGFVNIKLAYIIANNGWILTTTIFWLDIWLSGTFLSIYTHYKCHFIFQKYILIFVERFKKAIYRAQHWRVSAVARDNIWLLGTL